MSTTTATIFIGQAHSNDSGINPSHFILFTENSRPAIMLYEIEGSKDPVTLIPTVQNTIDDIYLLVASCVMGGLKINQDIHQKCMYDIFSEEERLNLYSETKAYLTENRIKLVFNLLDGSHLLNQIDLIKEYPNDFEITIPTFKKELHHWGNQVVTKEF
jgi:hypothetical protein